MLSVDARFALFTVVCCISTLCILPSTSVNAAVISRNPASSSSLPNEARSIDDSTAHSNQLPWSSQSIESKGVHKVRTTNPIKGLADAFMSRIKHPRSNRKRSHKSIIIPTDHGKNYLLSHARRADTALPQWISGHKNTTNAGNTTTAQSEESGTPGAVRIQSQSRDSTQGHRNLGSLYLTSSSGVYTLNASENNETRLYMVNAPPSTTRSSFDSSADDSTPVYLMIPRLQDSNDYCATYNDSPNKPEPMTMQLCNNYTAPDGSSTSQTFMYNPKSNELRPTWVDNTNTTAQAASLSNSTSTGSAGGSQPTSTGLASRDDSTVNTQNVTLVWDPASSKVNAADISNSPSVSQGSPSSSAVTMTRTVTVYQSGSSTMTSGSPSATGLNVEVVGSSSYSTSAFAASSMSMMDFSGSSASSVAPSPSMNAAAIAASIASSMSSSMSSASTSSTFSMASAADFSASASATSSADPSSGTFVAAVMQRSPWKKADSRL
ncbi:hypothetical protein JR316_0007858 [Psilocybe cubensis]|uniref:Uncharacterized protein n=2 Tax=Psilocybe cubensis TaxID=181762 RepID=A0ACB8GWC4_PSICU|nr:hypothetical protein JR316_0007858 [Psilocybe cubensis]KAH9479270.1 hypothetical protein JR316_0007858 [Psilocybe cubensis]